MSRKRKLLAIDLETYFDKECSIKKLGVSQYVQHPAFELNSLAYRSPQMKAAKAIGADEIPEFIDFLRKRDMALVAHNMYFDGYALSFKHGYVPQQLLCTYAMAQPLYAVHGPTSLDGLAKRLGLQHKIEGALEQTMGLYWRDMPHPLRHTLLEYNAADTDIGYGIFQQLVKDFPASELKVIDLTLRLFIEPMFHVHAERAQQVIQDERWAKEESCAAAGITEAEARSNKVFVDILQERGYECPMKYSEKQDKLIPALAMSDLPFQRMLESEDEELQSLAVARSRCKSSINETRAQSLLERVHHPVPVYLLYCAAHTMRFGGGDRINPQNLPRDGRLRSCLVPPPGYKLVIADAAQIEARMLAWFAGQDDLVEAFARGEDVYASFASKLYGKEINKNDHPDERFVGKTCLGADTQVLTQRGWVTITEVAADDQLWDGVEWVNHQGVLCAGVKPTIELSGVTMTPDHEILVGVSDQWMESQHVLENETAFQSALSLATLPSSVTKSTTPKTASTGVGDRCVGAGSVAQNTPTKEEIYAAGDLRPATLVQKLKLVQNVGGSTKTRCPTTSTELACSTVFPAPSVGVIHQVIAPTGITESAVSMFTQLGSKTAQSFSATCKRWKAGISQSWRWIASTLTGTTNRETSGSAPGATTCQTSERSKSLNPVYDLLNAGKRKRFTILSNSGPLIVHNSILGLGYQCGAAKFQMIMEAGMMGPPIQFTLEEAQRTVDTYRATYPRIKALWYELQRMIAAMYTADDAGVEFNGLVFKKERVLMPNGLHLQYPGLDFNIGKYDNAEFFFQPYDRRLRKKKVEKIYGGKFCENLIQSLARSATTYHMLEIANYYPPVLMAHDEVVLCVPEDRAEEALAYSLEVMAEPPTWAAGCPLKGEGHIADFYTK